MSETPKRYRAFISYSQKDKPRARRLHQALEGYRLPHGVDVAGINPTSRRLGRFFRDDDEMGAATDLGAALQGAIADAENLIVVCSPHAAQSRWVNEEVIHFKRTGRVDRIFAVIVGGEPTPSAERPERECFPPALRFELASDGSVSDRPAEPLALDVRKEAFHRLIVRLASGLVRTPFDDLWKREQRRARARTAALSLAVIATALLFAAVATQNLWRPRLDAYLRYARFAHSNVELTSARAGTTFQDCRQGSSDCPLMVVVPGGRFVMGSVTEMIPDSTGVLYEDESPQREITVASFAVSQNEITFADWNTCLAAGGCDGYRPHRAGWSGDDRPVINVNWDQAQSYVAWLSRVTGHRYRLLTEAEWEYADRAQTVVAPQTRYPWGDADPVCRIEAPNGAAVFDCPQQSTWDVGSFPANAFGLHDMDGNVEEWVEDCYVRYDATMLDAAAISSGPAGGACLRRVVRGGSWLDFGSRSADRKNYAPDFQGLGDLGFRIARTL